MKIAVIFPGVGYHADKPLLYYSAKIAKENGYETVNVPYGSFPAGVKGSKEKMEAAFFSALEQAENILADIDFGQYEDVLFLSKSVGTAVAAAYAKKKHLKTRNVYYTPVEQSFQFMDQPGVVFYGTADTWSRREKIEEACKKGGFVLYESEGADHSMETGNVAADLENLGEIMKLTEQYIRWDAAVRTGTAEDVDAAAGLEAACFSEAEAGTRESFAKRLQAFPDHFWFLEKGGRVRCMIDGMVSKEEHLRDEMFEDASLHDENGEWQMIFGVATHPECQGKGYMTILMRRMIEDARKQGRRGIVLTCKDRMIPFYERFGFVNEGLSESKHGGAVWYEMRLRF